MLDIRSGTNEKLPARPKFCLVCLASPVVNGNTDVCML